MSHLFAAAPRRIPPLALSDSWPRHQQADEEAGGAQEDVDDAVSLRSSVGFSDAGSVLGTDASSLGEEADDDSDTSSSDGAASRRLAPAASSRPRRAVPASTSAPPPVPPPAAPARAARERRTAWLDPRDLPGVARPWAEALRSAAAAAAAQGVAWEPARDGGVWRAELGTIGVGAGVQLWFAQLRAFARLCAAATVLLTPAIGLFLLAQAQLSTFDAAAGIFARASLGSLLPCGGGGGGAGGASTWVGVHREGILVATSALDAAATLLLLIGALRMRRVGAAVAADAAVAVTLGRYAVLLRGFPASAVVEGPQLAREVREHAEALAAGAGAGPHVAEVVLLLRRQAAPRACAREAPSALELFAAYAAARRRRAAAAARAAVRAAALRASVDYRDCCGLRAGVEARELAAGKAGVAVARAAICDAFADVDAPRVATCAFITFHTQAAASAAVRRRPRLPFRGGRALTVSPAPEPSNVRWANLASPRARRGAFSLALAAATFVLLLATLAVELSAESATATLPPALNAKQSQLYGKLVCDSVWPLDGTTANTDAPRALVTALAARAPMARCDSFVANGVFLGDASGAAIRGSDPRALNASASDAAYECAAAACLGQFCSARGLSAAAADRDQLRGFCGAYWRAWVRSTALLVSISAVVFVVDFATDAVIDGLARAERHWSRSGHETSCALRAFLAEVVNTALVFMLVYAAVSGKPDGVGGLPYVLHGAYADLTVGWYRDVGSAITRTMLMKAVQPHLTPFIGLALHAAWARATRHTAVTQRQLDALYARPPFTLAPRYGKLLARLTITLTFASGLPLLPLFFAAYCALGWAADRVLLLRFARRPPLHNDTLFLTSLRCVPWAVALHYGFGIWFYGGAVSTWVYPSARARLGGGLAQLGAGNFTDASVQLNPALRLAKVAVAPQLLGAGAAVLALLSQSGLMAWRVGGAAGAADAKAPAAGASAADAVHPATPSLRAAQLAAERQRLQRIAATLPPDERRTLLANARWTSAAARGRKRSGPRAMPPVLSAMSGPRLAELSAPSAAARPSGLSTRSGASGISAISGWTTGAWAGAAGDVLPWRSYRTYDFTRYRPWRRVFGYVGERGLGSEEEFAAEVRVCDVYEGAEAAQAAEAADLRALVSAARRRHGRVGME